MFVNSVHDNSGKLDLTRGEDGSRQVTEKNVHNLENYKAIDLRTEVEGAGVGGGGGGEDRPDSSSPSWSGNTPPIDNIQIESVKDVTYVKGKRRGIPRTGDYK